MKNKVLVTGGAGFIGSHVCEMYLKEDYEVLCVDNLSSGKVDNICHLLADDRFTFVEADINDTTKMLAIFQSFRPTIINHHAAQKSVVSSIEDPMYDLDINLGGLLILLQCVQKFPIEKFIYVSSGGALSKVIEGTEKSKESDTPQLISPYAITKYAGEKYLDIYANTYGFDYTVLRYANVFGPRQIPDGECGVVPIFVTNILANKPSVLMTYPDMPKGCTRDYVYVGDVVEANRLVSEKAVNTVINIGTGDEIAILDIYNTILDVFEKDIAITIEGPRAGDVKRSVLANDRAKELTGWTNQVSLKEGLVALREAMLQQQA